MSTRPKPNDSPYLHAMDKLRNELLPINYIELDSNSLVLGSSSRCVILDYKQIGNLITSLLTIQQELHERQTQ